MDAGFSATTNSRFYGFDAARSFMMLLGVLVHVILIAPYFLAASSGDRAVLDWLFWGIHVFRMPTFFLLSGFFSVALVRKSGYRGFLISRFKRVVSVLIAAELIIAAVLLNVPCSACSVAGAFGYLNYGWLHLWFLAYLSIIAHGYLLVRWLVERFAAVALRQRVSRWFDRVGLQPSWIFVFALVSCLIPGYLDSNGQLRMSIALVPDISLLALFAAFFAAGVMLYRAKDWAIENLVNRLRTYFSLAIVFSVIFFENARVVAGNPVAKVSYTLAMWFFTAGILGLFAKHLNRSTPRRKFLGEASYWVYLWHPVVVLALAWVAGRASLNLWLAMPLIIVITLAATLASYRWWVRDTLIGAWISGRRRAELGLPKLFGAKVGAMVASESRREAN